MKRLSQMLVLFVCIATTLGLFNPIRSRSTVQAAGKGDDIEAVLAQQPIYPLIGKQVQLSVAGGSGNPNPEGKLEAADSNWVRIRTTEGQVKCYAIGHLVFVTEAKR